MKVLLYIYVIGYAMCEIDLDQAYRFLIKNKGELLQGQWTNSKDHLVYINIVFDNQNLILQVYPKQNNLLHEKHRFRLSYELNNSSYQFDPVKSSMTWRNIKVDIHLENDIKHPPSTCSATLQLVEIENPQMLIVSSEFDDECIVSEDRIKLFIFSRIAYKTQVQLFTLLVLGISTFQIVCSAKYLNSNPMQNNGASLTYSIILTQDIYICLFSSLLFEIPTFFYFTPCLVSQLLAILFDLKIKAKLSKIENENTNSTKNLFLQLLELSIISYLFINVRHSTQLILLNLYLVPQIYLTCVYNQRQKFNKYYFGAVFPRVLYSLYVRGSSDNILQLAQRPNVVYLIVFLVVTQFAIYYCQCQYGWFIYRKNQHNYFIEPSLDKDESECAICLNLLSQKSEDQPKFDEPIIAKTISKANQNQLLMNTPCNHQFHPVCLTQWMQISLTCPLCKKQLPQIF